MLCGGVGRLSSSQCLLFQGNVPVIVEIGGAFKMQGEV